MGDFLSAMSSSELSCKKLTSLLRPVPTIRLNELSKIDLSTDVLNVIKSYCYYNYRDSLIINCAKWYKQMTNSLILEAMSRNTHHFENHWGFGFYIDHPTERLQLQAENCDRCGNYVSISEAVYIPPSLVCGCGH